MEVVKLRFYCIYIIQICILFEKIPQSIIDGSELAYSWQKNQLLASNNNPQAYVICLNAWAMMHY